MSIETFAPVSGITNPEMFPLYYERKLLQYVKENLIATKFGQKFTLPKNSGKSAVFTRFQPLPKVTTDITFKPTPTEGQSIANQQITVDIKEYANYIDLDEFSDITSFVPLVDIATDLLAYNAQQSLDTVAMNELTAGTNVLYAGGATSRDTVSAPISKSDIRQAATILMRNNIPTFQDGYYVCMIHPDKIMNLFQDQELMWLSMTRKDAISTGYIGEYAGVKFYVSTTLPVLNGGIYQTLVLGANAYGVVDLDGTTLQMTYTNLDKLGRVKTIGWKAYFAAKRLYEPGLVRIESK